MNNLSQEADMGYVRDFVAKIAEALVAATELPKQIAQMQADVAALSGNLEHVKTENAKLDTMLNDTRRQRDEAEQKLSEVKARLDDSTHGWETEIKAKQDAQAELNRVQALLEAVKKERDDYGLKHMAAEDRATEAEAKLKKLREALGMYEPPMVAQPIPEAEAKDLRPGAVVYTNPVPQTEQPIPNSLKRVYEGDFGFNELSLSTEGYDNSVHRYYRTA